jgi:hypothetical protein
VQKPARKIAMTIGSIAFGIAAIGIAYVSWAEWHFKQYGGYAVADLDPIPGAELISYESESSLPLPDYDTTWTYRVPASYTDKLYKDCAAMHYETGALGYGEDGTERIDPKKPGCHTKIELHHEIIMVRFVGDRLTIEDSYMG